MKNVGIIKRRIAICLIFLMCINSFAAVVSDNDGSAFITKAEFDSLKNNFQSQIDSYNQSIDSKIDGAIASYLSGISVAKTSTHKSLFDALGISTPGYKAFAIIGKNNKTWFTQTWASGQYFGDFDLEPRVYNWFTWNGRFGNSLAAPPNNGFRVGNISFQMEFVRTGGANTNVIANGSGIDIQNIQYGLRCFVNGHNDYRYYTTASNWVGLYPIWFDPNNTILASPSITFNIEKPIRTAYQSSGGCFSTNFGTSKTWLALREGAAGANWPAYTPGHPLQHTDGTWSDTNWSLMDPQHYYANNFNNYSAGSWGYVMNSATSDKFGDNYLYFWPGGGSNKLFVMDNTNVGSNFKAVTLEAGHRWGDWAALGWNMSQQSWNVAFDEELRLAAESRGYKTYPNQTSGTAPADLNVWLKGTLYDFDCENRRLPLSTLRYAQPTSQLGKDVILGETPLLIHNVEKNGKMTIDGGGLRLTFMQAPTSYKDTAKVYIAFTKQGAVNEVDTGTTAAPKWDVNNTIPFEYKNETNPTWTAAPGNKFYQAPAGSSKFTNFRFDVEKGDDIYMHVVCEDFRDNQNIIVYAKPDTVCMLEAED